jgi:acyl carrier protein
MRGSLDEAFKTELKRLIIEACDKDVAVEQVGDDVFLFGETSVLALDSLDALQISMEIQRRYGVVLADSKELRRVFTSINSLADYIKSE